MGTIFSQEEVAKLRQHPCVFSCTDRSVTYTNDLIRTPKGIQQQYGIAF